MLATQPHWPCGAAANLGLPQRVEAFDGVLHPVLEWRHEYGRHAELQAHTADATHGMGMWRWALKHVVVVELSIGGKFVAPANAQATPGECIRGPVGWPR